MDYIAQVVVSAFVFPFEKVLYYLAFYIVLASTICSVLCVEVILDYFRFLRAQRTDKKDIIKNR